MTHKQRAAAALERRIPDRVPTFELEFQLCPELVGGDFLTRNDLKDASPRERERLLNQNVEFMLKVYGMLEYDILPVHYLAEEDLLETARIIRRLTGDEYMLTTHGDGTFAIPDGNKMVEFAVDLFERADEMHEEADRRANDAIEHNLRYIDAGFDSFMLCCDYCYNTGPFLSPVMFAEWVTPYLERIVRKTREAGAYVIKHTDGDIMPILDQLVSCNPHALHSIDPMAGVDIAEVKRLVGDQVCLIGNVNCAAMQTGTDEEVIASAEYCLTHAKPGGGYIFSTSNVPFRGLPLSRYQLILDVWKRMRDYA